jgi:hypothetical protein
MTIRWGVCRHHHRDRAVFTCTRRTFVARSGAAASRSPARDVRRPSDVRDCSILLGARRQVDAATSRGPTHARSEADPPRLASGTATG